jgi:hypothetical protein
MSSGAAGLPDGEVHNAERGPPARFDADATGAARLLNG